MSAEERRTSVVSAAITEFAARGLDGTSTESIAARAGISQPYLFRLFPTKKALFVACIAEGFGRVERSFRAASEGLSGAEALDAMGRDYEELLADRELLLLQHQSYAACGDPEIRGAVRACFGRLFADVEARSGCSPEELQRFFAMGMLCNVLAAMDLVGVPETWAQALMPGSCEPG
jgi:AcrR family transcriptional regulator